jgi:hypothetical protein
VCRALTSVYAVYMALLSLCNCSCALVVVRYSVSCLDECVCCVYASVVTLATASALVSKRPTALLNAIECCITDNSCCFFAVAL